MLSPCGAWPVVGRPGVGALSGTRGHVGGEPDRPSGRGGGGGRDESVRRRAGSQWIVAARPLCHLQYPVAF